jgi:hypothetical protein
MTTTLALLAALLCGTVNLEPSPDGYPPRSIITYNGNMRLFGWWGANGTLYYVPQEQTAENLTPKPDPGTLTGSLNYGVTGLHDHAANTYTTNDPNFRPESDRKPCRPDPDVSTSNGDPNYGPVLLLSLAAIILLYTVVKKGR